MQPDKARAPGIVVLGDINVDVLAPLEAFPTPGGDFLSPALQLHCGGVGANTALALAKWDVPVRLLGCTGRDWFGDFALRALQQEGVDVSFVQQTDQTMTGLIFIAVSPDGQRTMFGSRGANAALEVSSQTESFLEGMQALHLMGYNFLSPSVTEAAEKLLQQIHQRGAWVSLDVGMAPSNRIRRTIWEVAGKVDILFASLDEAASLTDEHDPEKAFAALEQCGAREVVVKLGPRGCLFREQGKLRQAPPFPVAAADTTGTGDAFTAMFLRARLHGWSNPEAAVLANAAGAAAASVVGAGAQMPGPEQVLPLLAGCHLPDEWEPVRARVSERLSQELRPAATAGS